MVSIQPSRIPARLQEPKVDAYLAIWADLQVDVETSATASFIVSISPSPIVPKYRLAEHSSLLSHLAYAVSITRYLPMLIQIYLSGHRWWRLGRKSHPLQEQG